MTNARSDLLEFLHKEWARLDALENHTGKSKDDECRWRLLRRADEGSLEEQGLVSILEECLARFSAINLQSYGVADVSAKGSRVR